MKRALITGIAGQDGSYMAELLLKKGYEVHGITRRVVLEDPEHRLWRLGGFADKLTLHCASVQDHAAVFRVIEEISPQECYHFAAESFVNFRLDEAFSAMNSNIRGTHVVLSAIKERAPGCRVYFAASSEMFGNAESSPQNEGSRFCPRSSYGHPAMKARW